MRLLYLAASEFPIRQARGIQIAHTVAGLAALGHTVTLVAGGTGGPDEAGSFGFYGLETPERVRLVRVPTWHPPVPPGTRWTSVASRIWVGTHLSALRLALPMLAMSERPDAVFARGLRVADLALRSRGSRGVPLLYELHFLDSLNLEEDDGRRTARSERWRNLEARVLNAAAGIITLTAPAREVLTERYALRGDSIEVVPSGTSATELEREPSARESDLAIYAGQLQDWKGVELLVDALALVPGARLEVIGGLSRPGHPDRNQLGLAARAQASGVAERVIFSGPLPYPEVQRRLRRAAVATIPLRDTVTGRIFTSPLKAFDYMWSGTPIVASDLPSVRDVLTHERNALLSPPGEVAAFGAAMRRLFSDPRLGERLAQQASEDVRGFTWQARAERIDRFLHARIPPPPADLVHQTSKRG